MRILFGLCTVMLMSYVNPNWAVAQDDIKLITYNLRLDVASDGLDNWNVRKDDLGRYLKQQEPDFIGIQEGLYGQVIYLDSVLSTMNYCGDGREGGQQGEYCAIYYNRDRWKLESSEMFWLSESPDEVSKGWDAACHRVCTQAVFSNARGHEIAVLNTHFDHMGQEARLNSAQLIIEKIIQLSSEMPLVLMGDFNVEPDDPVYSLLVGSLSDSYDITVDNEMTCGTFNGFKISNYDCRRIDYIFINDKLHTESITIDMPLTGKGRQLSDHFPVVAYLKFK